MKRKSLIALIVSVALTVTGISPVSYAQEIKKAADIELESIEEECEEEVYAQEDGAAFDDSELAYCDGIYEGEYGSAPVFQEGYNGPVPEIKEFECADGEECIDGLQASYGGYTVGEVRDYLYEALSNREAEIDVSKYDIPVSDYSSLVYSVINIYADLPFVSSQVPYTYYKDSGIVVTINPKYLEREFDMDTFYAEADKALAQVTEDMSDVEKALVIHDYLVYLCKYDSYGLKQPHLSTDNMYKAYGALVDHKAVCNGYALAYVYLMRRLGIQCYYVSSSLMNHGWNAIVLDGKLYHVDTTWDDPVNGIYDADGGSGYIGRVDHNYLLLSDEVMQDEDHEHEDYTVAYYQWGDRVVDVNGDVAYATDDTYKNAYWRNVHSPLVYRDGYYYGITRPNTYDLSLERVAAEEVAGEEDYESIYNQSEALYYLGASSVTTAYRPGFGVIGNKLYFNNYNRIYEVDLDTEILTTVAKTPAGIKGMEVRNDKVYYTTDWADHICCDISKPYQEDIDPEPEVYGEYEGNTLTLEGNIVVRFYFTLCDAAVTDPAYEMKLECEGGETIYAPVDKCRMANGKLCYTFDYPISAKAMTNRIKATLCKNRVPVMATYGYSVESYCKNMYQSERESAKTKDLLVKLANYGAYAQKYFGYNTQNLANRYIIADGYAAAHDNVNIENPNHMSISGEEEGIAPYAASLILESETTIRYYFELEDDNISDYTFRCKETGKRLIPHQASIGDNYYYVDVENIVASKLDELYTVSVGDLEVSYSALAYMYNKSKSSDEKLVDLVKAMYLYNASANNYFGD